MAFVAVILAGSITGLSVAETIVRGSLAGVVGFFVGWLLFGKVGMDLAKEAAGPIELSEPEPKEDEDPKKGPTEESAPSES
jgi:hypothetical protein